MIVVVLSIGNVVIVNVYALQDIIADCYFSYNGYTAKIFCMAFLFYFAATLNVKSREKVNKTIFIRAKKDSSNINRYTL